MKMLEMIQSILKTIQNVDRAELSDHRLKVKGYWLTSRTAKKKMIRIDVQYEDKL